MKVFFAGAMIAWMFLIANSYAGSNDGSQISSSKMEEQCVAGNETDVKRPISGGGGDVNKGNKTTGTNLSSGKAAPAKKSSK